LNESPFKGLRTTTLGLKRGKRWWSGAGVAVVAIGTLIVSFSTVALASFSIGPVGTAAGFEDNDGDMAVNQGLPTDWNSFSAASWSIGTAPYRQTGPLTVNGWNFVGLEDAKAVTSDTGFAGGTKQDNNCATVIGSKSPNKDDLSGIMVAFKTVGGFSDGNHTFLMLNWTRIPQNTTSASAHVGFEFNQSKTACPAGSDGLVTRTAGDLLLVYDFTGGSTVPPTLSLSRWVTSGSCQVGSDAPPCWGTFTVLPCGTAEANVDTGLTVSTVTQGGCSIPGGSLPSSVFDAVTPPASGTASTTSTLGTSEFGEAGVDLTKANVFPPGQCENFGKVEGISRSSGDSNTAAMEDLVGPGTIHLSNCGEVKIIKHTDLRGVNKDFGYTTNIPSGSATGAATFSKTPDTTGATTTFTLNDSAGVDNTVNTEDITNVQPGNSYTVNETVASGFTLESLSCDPSSGTTFGVQDLTIATRADITVAAGGLVTCTYVNKQNTARLATQVSDSGPVFPAAPVHDTATVTGNQSADTPSGTVTFFLCGPIPTGACDGTTNVGTSIGPGTLSGSNGVAIATSPDVNTSSNPLTPGRYCFLATWPGDTNYPGALAEFGGANGTNECFTVRTIPTTTTTTPSVGSGGTTTFGSSVTDHAIVQATQSGDGTPTGTVTFFICNPTQTVSGACPDGNGTQVGSPVNTTAVANSSPPASSADSISVTVNMTGTWCFRAVYTPGGANGSNYTGSSDATSGECFTVNDTTASTSGQTWVPNDTATVTAASGAPLNGTLSAQLYTGSTTCATGGTAVSGQLYTKTLTNATSAGDRTLTTTNSTFTVSNTEDVSWLITFTSTDPNVSGSTHCESTSLTITN